MPETKKKILMATLTPIMPSMTIRAGGPYTSGDLGKLLSKMDDAVPAVERCLTLTREKHHEYIRGLRDAHMMEANALYDMLCKVTKVEVTFHEEDEKP